MAWIMFEGEKWNRDCDTVIQTGEIVSFSSKMHEALSEDRKGQWVVVFIIVTRSETYRFEKYVKNEGYAKYAIKLLREEIGFRW